MFLDICSWTIGSLLWAEQKTVILIIFIIEQNSEITEITTLLRQGIPLEGLYNIENENAKSWFFWQTWADKMVHGKQPKSTWR